MEENQNIRKFGTFTGVFTPAILTILGVILYLRLGWVVGSVGLSGTLIIIFLAHIATITTGLSLASLATNVKVGAGGFYAFVSRSLGAEVGGAIGIPLYISQTLSVSLYVFGFTEAWVSIFPQHNFKIVLIAVLGVITLLSFIGANFALKMQYGIMVLIVLSLISFYLSPLSFTVQPDISFGKMFKGDFWYVFAVFFPAVTGIGAGVAMSGELKNPKKNLPWGIMAAVSLGLVIYIVSAIWYSGLAESELLVKDNMILVESAKSKWLILLGIMGATLSSALGSIVGAPRILQALSNDKIIPFYKYFSKLSKNGNPRNAVVLTGIIVFISFFVGDLDSIASLLTMFFLISYGIINLTVFVEKGIKIPSFRPLFSIPLIVPFVGMIWCFVIMFLINTVFALISIVVIIGAYAYFVRKEINSQIGDMRSAIFNAVAEWAVKTSIRLPQHEKSWKPNLLVPVKDPALWGSKLEIVKSIAFPSGTIRLVNVNEFKKSERENFFRGMFGNVFKGKEEDEYSSHRSGYEEKVLNMNGMISDLKDEGFFATSTVVDSANYLEGINSIIQTMKAMFFPPNILFLTISSDKSKDNRLQQMVAIAVREHLGVIIFSPQLKNIKNRKKYINVWLRVGSPNINLAVLTALQLEKNWGTIVRLITVVSDENEKESAEMYLSNIIETGRLKTRTKSLVLTGSFYTAVENAEDADINIFGIALDGNCSVMHNISERIKASCLFIMDSGREKIEV